MNHTKRINEVARRNRHLTRRLVKEAVETYLEFLADEIAEGDWAEIHRIGKIQVVTEPGSGLLWHKNTEGNYVPRKVGLRLRTKMRLAKSLKDQVKSR